MDENKKQFDNAFSYEIWKNNYQYKDETYEQFITRLVNNVILTEIDNKKLLFWFDNMSLEERQKELMTVYYDILYNKKFIPGGRIMANLGIKEWKNTTLMNCFVHDQKDINYKDSDSINGIYDAVKAQANTLKSEGGYGHNFSKYRPAGAFVEGIGARTPGVLSFMELWDKSSDIITRGSTKKINDESEDKAEKRKIRKGAMLGVLNCWHPDILDFIKIKQNANVLTKFNLSVGITSGFMNAVKNDKDWNLKFPDTNFEKYEEEWNGDIETWERKKYPVIIYKTLKARELWNEIMYATYTRNEPGILFLDLANKLNPLYYVEKVQTANPCGEIIMSLGACNLGSINLTKFIHKNKETNKFEFNYDDFIKTIFFAVRYLDSINDISNVPLKEYKDSMLEKRRIGLGTMGLGSIHFMLGIPYGSDESIKLINKIYKTKSETELLASSLLGKEKGNFPLFDKEKYFNSYWWKTLKIDKNIKESIQKLGCMRNSHHSANAPTGNSGIYAGVVSGGIEPVFDKEYYRYVIVNSDEIIKLKEQGLDIPDKNNMVETNIFKFKKLGNETILEGTFNDIEYQIDGNRGLTKKVLVEDYGWKFVKENLTKDELIENEKNNIYKTATELTIDEHLNPLAEITKWTNLSTSKTINLSEDYSFDDFKNVYLSAYENNIKGVTTYRQGTMTEVLKKKEEINEYQNDLDKLMEEANGHIIKEDVKLPDEYYSKGYIIKDNNKKKWYVNVAFADSKYRKPFALFVHTNSYEQTEVTNELISKIEELCQTKGIPEEIINKQREKYSGQKNVTKMARAIGMALRHNISLIDVVEVLDEFTIEISSFIFHIKKLLSKFIRDGTHVEKEKCENCGRESIVFQQGCKICNNCGWSKC